MEPVRLTALEITDFRNLTDVAFAPHPRFNILAGSNGAGKTNVLEAVYLLGALRSFRTTVRGELVRLSAQEAMVKGAFNSFVPGRTIALALSKESRRVRVDGKPLSDLASHFAALPMVLFHPASMELVQGGPEARRRFLSRALFQADPSYPALHRSYVLALESRNVLLKVRPVARRSVAAFDEPLASFGVDLIERRRRFLDELGGRFSAAFGEISDGLLATLCYRPRHGGDKAAFLDALSRRLPEDAARGHTTLGPHADDIEITLGRSPARRFASQGQQRLLALALKIAETRTLTAVTGKVPILLLDDISSELDRERNQRLFAFLAGVGSQIFITTTHLDHILITEERRDFTVSDGVVSDCAME